MRTLSSEDTEQRAACPAQASESEISSVDRERCRRSCAGERHTRQGRQRGRYRAASGLCSFSFRQGDRRCRHRAAKTPSSERPVPPKLSKARAAASIECVADAAAAASITPNGAIIGAHAEQRAVVPPKLPKARAAALIESIADVAAAASVTPDRAISGADADQREARAAQASESESGSVDRKRCRRNCGGERHTRQGDQRCTRQAARGICSSSF